MLGFWCQKLQCQLHRCTSSCLKKSQSSLTWRSDVDCQLPGLWMWLVLDWKDWKDYQRPSHSGSHSQQVFAEDEPLKMLFTGLTKQQYVLWWGVEWVVSGSTGGFGALISLHYHWRKDEKMSYKKLCQTDRRIRCCDGLWKEPTESN